MLRYWQYVGCSSFFLVPLNLFTVFVLILLCSEFFISFFQLLLVMNLVFGFFLHLLNTLNLILTGIHLIHFLTWLHFWGLNLTSILVLNIEAVCRCSSNAC
jgi:hypothetical protein